MSYKWEQLTEEQIREAIESSVRYSEAAEKMGYSKNSSGKTKAVKAAAEKYNISLSHFLNLKSNDLTNQIFGQLTVLSKDEERSKKKNKSYWFCQCSCGFILPNSIPTSNLRRGNTTKCKYCRAENLIGQKFGRLTVIERHITEDNKVYWKCKCDCGNIVTIRPDSLKSGHTKSCGCLQKETVKENNFNRSSIQGQRFGKLVVLCLDEEKTNERHHYYWKCKCDCGTIKSVYQKALVSGHTQSCGCVRSRGEEKIAQILSENNIPFEREYVIEDCLLSTGGNPKIDFVVNGIFIEYQGEQHYDNRKSGWFTEEKFEIIQRRDKEKREYCLQKNIPLIEIPYWDYNKLSIKYLLTKMEEINGSF